MYLYRWQEDPTRVSQNELGEEEVRRRISALTGLEAGSVSMDAVVKTFCLGVPPSEVGIFLVVLFGRECRSLSSELFLCLVGLRGFRCFLVGAPAPGTRA